MQQFKKLAFLQHVGFKFLKSDKCCILGISTPTIGCESCATTCHLPLASAMFLVFFSGSGLGPKIWKRMYGHIVIAVNLPVFGTASEITFNPCLSRVKLAPCDVGHLLTSSIPISSLFYW